MGDHAYPISLNLRYECIKLYPSSNRYCMIDQCCSRYTFGVHHTCSRTQPYLIARSAYLEGGLPLYKPLSARTMMDPKLISTTVIFETQCNKTTKHIYSFKVHRTSNRSMFI